MRKFFVPLLLLTTVFLGACTMQDTMNPAIFAERFCEYSGFTAARQETLFDENKALCFAKSEAGTQILLGMRTDEGGNVISVSASVDFTDGEPRETAAADFLTACDGCVEIFAQEDSESYAEIAKALGFAKELPKGNTAYHDTQWYRYALIVTDGAAYFSVESKRAVPDSAVEFSLRETESFSPRETESSTY